jgi:tetratricopeptide (TPR) repeat protein
LLWQQNEELNNGSIIESAPFHVLGETMEKTPLELYETAYNLQYLEKKIPEAIEYYNQLIKGFPDSNECGYAVIQLQKLKTGNVSETIRNTQISANPLTVVSFIIACLSLLASGAVMYYSKEQLKIEQDRMTLTTSVLGKILRGEDDEALGLLTELKRIHKEDITPFELSADIYRRNNFFQKAKEEYEMFFRLNPDRQPSKGELGLMESDSELSKPKIIKTAPKQDIVNENDSIFNEFPSDEKKLSTLEKTGVSVIPKKAIKNVKVDDVASPTRKTAKKLKEKVQSSAPVKGLYIVDPDSLSYF